MTIINYYSWLSTILSTLLFTESGPFLHSSLQDRIRPWTGRIHSKGHPERTCLGSPILGGDTLNCLPASDKLRKEGAL